MPIEVCTSGSSNGSEGVRVSNVFCREFPSASIDALAGETQIAIPCATCSYTSGMLIAEILVKRSMY